MRRAFLAVALMLLVLLPTVSVQADRAELADVLRMLPSDGPPEEYGNVVYRRLAKKRGMAPVVFQHWKHRGRYTCRVCHFELPFSMRKGASQITRAAYLRGEFCGACHNGKIAFSAAEAAKNCDRCHAYTTDHWQEDFRRFAADLPKAMSGHGIDWAKAIRTGLLKPRNSMGEEVPIPPLPQKIAKPLKLGDVTSREVVYFSHEEHMAEMDCSNCHPDIFNIKKKSTELFSMDKNLYGLYCGSCHMRIAFPMGDCRRCHPSMKSMRTMP